MNNMDIVVVTSKPEGYTSRKWDDFVQKQMGADKAGHIGTLDPAATGVQVVLLGRATRLSSFLSRMDKLYDATIRLGVSTDTYDRDGTVASTSDNWKNLDSEKIRHTIASFVGENIQEPPPYSAAKVDGKPLYKWTRQGIKKSAPPKKVVIYSMDIKKIELPYIRLTIHSSKGAYVRSIAVKIGELLGCDAHLFALNRIAEGPFKIDEALTKDALLNTATNHTPPARGVLTPLNAMKRLLPTVNIERSDVQAIKKGQLPFIRELALLEIKKTSLFAIACNGALVAIATLSGENRYELRKVFS